MIQNYLVSQDIHCSNLWVVSSQRHNVSATVWETDQSLGFHRTAKSARNALEAREGGRLTVWTKRIGRGCATYHAQNYTGPVMSGSQLAVRQRRLDEIAYLESMR
jgi:hypothetical protein